MRGSGSRRRGPASSPPGFPACSRHLPHFQRGLQRERRHRTGPGRPVRRGDLARPGTAPAGAGRRGERGPARADAAHSLARGGPPRRRRPRRSSWPTRTGPAGIRMIAEGSALLDAASRGAARPYQLQAAIAAVHAGTVLRPTDWSQIAALYRQLARRSPSPVVEVNRAVAVGMADGPLAGLAVLAPVVRSGQLDGYGPLHAARPTYWTARARPISPRRPGRGRRDDRERRAARRADPPRPPPDVRLSLVLRSAQPAAVRKPRPDSRGWTATRRSASSTRFKRRKTHDIGVLDD